MAALLTASGQLADSALLTLGDLNLCTDVMLQPHDSTNYLVCCADIAKLTLIPRLIWNNEIG